MFGHFDAVFIIGTLLSLVVIAFTFDGVAGESEEGTLHLVLANPVSRARVLLGKWLGSFASVLMIFVPCSLAAVLVALDHPLVELRGEDGLILLLSGVVCRLYMGIFLSLGLLVSCRCRQSRSALLVLLAIWMLPSIAPYLAAGLTEGDPPLMVEANINRVRAEAERRAWTQVSAFIRDNG